MAEANMDTLLVSWLLDKSRCLTKEESEALTACYTKLFIPTGRNLFDLVDDE